MFPFFRRRASNPGLIWLDERSARRDISSRARAGDITAAEEENLAKFATDGYFVIRIALSAEDAAAIDRDVNRLWSTKPENVAFAYDSPPKRFSAAVESSDRKPRHRIHELHAASEQALQLYLHPVLHRYASLILGETAVATQSLYFEFGSQQALHRDSTVVPTPQFGRLVAAWIALEDISPESGPLAYVPGSQRFPFYDFGTPPGAAAPHASRGTHSGDYTYDPSRHTDADVAAAMAFYATELERSGLPVHQFNAARGEVLIWHSALMHGGSAPIDEHRTRKSFVVHYSTLSSQRSRECAVNEVIGGQIGDSVFTTSQILERGGAFGFANPLDGTFLYRR
jgi:ectoine hydroxylase-related dioxygenase (phytanoyl-CoA dioxygenase family)